MNRYIDSEKLKAEILKLRSGSFIREYDDYYEYAKRRIIDIIDSLQQEQPNNMIQWTGNNLKEVIDFTGKSQRFGEWFNSWEEYENYVHTHNDILKLFCNDGSHFEVSVGAWIVKTPDGYNVPSVARFISLRQEQPEVDLEKEVKMWKNKHGIVGMDDLWIKFARHFYELGLNARKKEEK